MRRRCTFLLIAGSYVFPLAAELSRAMATFAFCARRQVFVFVLAFVSSLFSADPSRLAFGREKLSFLLLSFLWSRGYRGLWRLPAGGRLRYCLSFEIPKYLSLILVARRDNVVVCTSALTLVGVCMCRHLFSYL